MPKTIRIRKGLDIKLLGEASKTIAERATNYFALKPTDFHGIIPKLDVKEGDRVKAGSVLFHDKNNERLLFTSPVSGSVAQILRGVKRVIQEIVIQRDGNMEYEDFGKVDPGRLSREEVVDRLTRSGIWPVIRQRPYSVIANPSQSPKSIFISCFDSAPLAPDYAFILKDRHIECQTGLESLAKLTDGKIYLGVKHGHSLPFDQPLNPRVEINYFSGPHPAGNVGIQISQLDPVNKGDIVWYLNPQDVAMIGTLFLTGRYDAARIIALTGSEVTKPCYYKIFRGTSVQEIIADQYKGDSVRFISGNVLTGKMIDRKGFLGFYDNQITVIPEGKYHEFIGWGLPGFHKFSASRTFFSWLTPGRKFRLDTNMHGAERAIVMTGQFERVFPMNIYPLHLVKAILARDIDRMEALGIYEVDEEDFALCEFIDTSKMEIQTIVREGLDYIRKEMN